MAIPYHVFKFGGTSVKDASRIRKVVELIQQEDATVSRVVVVSALGGVTDVLLNAIHEAVARSGKHRLLVEQVRSRHMEALEALVKPEEQPKILAELDTLFVTLTELLDGVSLLRECTPRAMDAIGGMGERLSVPLVAAAFRQAGEDAFSVYAAPLIRTDDLFGEANVDFETTNTLIAEAFADMKPGQIAVVTGFVGSTARGVQTTLGRSGSDYTATILAGALKSQRVIIWTDVDGVLSADPRMVPEAQTLSHLHYEEAAELAYFGAKVLHPRTMRPLVEGGLPLLIKNTMNPDAPGTWITNEHLENESAVRAVTTIKGVSLVTIEGTGMVGVPGISARAFGAMAAKGINLIMISQASSEQSLVLVVREQDTEAALASARETFALELARGDVDTIQARKNCAVLVAVGDGMRSEPGVAGRMFSALGREGINVLGLAMSAAQNSITAIIDGERVREAVRVVHQVFIRGLQEVRVVLVGATGGVGKALLGMLERQTDAIEAYTGLRMRLIGMASSSKMRLALDGLPADPAVLQQEGAEALDLEVLVDRLLDLPPGRILFVDCTASDALPPLYPTLLENGIAVVTPNKRANTRELSFYKRLQVLDRETPFYYETTVGAGLPVISTLRDLLRSGDQLRTIEGVLSGTLAFVFSELSKGVSFSQAVLDARRRGYTEPDPRDDLSGTDVARKLLTLAREAHLAVELSDVDVENLVPEALRSLPLDQFLARVPELDAAWNARMAALQPGQRLAYLGSVRDGKLRVAVETIDETSPFSRLRDTDSMVAYTTHLYQRPLVVSGPGAGPEVTAAGVLADVVHAARRMD